jgi:hypothetical protein
MTLDFRGDHPDYGPPICCSAAGNNPVSGEMQMRNYFTTISCVALVALGVSTVLAQEAGTQSSSGEGPSLAATMSFIQEKLKAQASYQSRLDVFADVVADPGTCQLTLTTAKRPVPGREFIFIKIKFSFRDVEKIEATPIHGYDSSETSPGLHVLMNSRTGVHHHSEQKFPGAKKLKISDFDEEGALLNFPDEDIADRVAKAMIHAVELCGGGSKPEPF